MKKKCILAIIGIFLMTFNAFSDSTIQDNKEVLTEITPGPAKIVSGYKGAKEGVQTIFTYSEDSMYTIYTRVFYYSQEKVLVLLVEEILLDGEEQQLEQVQVMEKEK